MKAGYHSVVVFILGIFGLVAINGCSSTQPLTEFEIQHPAKLSIKRNIKKIFIDPDYIQNTNDKLGIKSMVIKKLADRLNQFGRFKVFVGPVKGINPEKETVALVQGGIVSGELVEDGQYTEVVTCKGGISGYSGGAAGTTTQQGVTVSRRGLLCKSDNINTATVEAGVGALLSLAGVETVPDPLDEVVRVYKYKNISLFAQVSFSITELGKKREVITIRSDSSDFGRQIVQSSRNVHESYVSIGDALQLLISPVAPLHFKKYALVSESNPASTRGKWVGYVVPKASNILAEEKDSIIDRLVTESLDPFIRTISPYSIKAKIAIDESGESDAVELIEKGEWKKARSILAQISSREAADEYNYGLTFEGGAETEEDYIDAKRLYLSALNQEPSKIIYAQGVGRMEKRLREYRIIQDQLK